MNDFPQSSKRSLPGRARSPESFKWLGLVGLFLILIPKINIVPIPGQTAGLRIDDVLLALCAVPFVFSLLMGRLRLDSLGYWRFIFVCFLSYSSATLLGWAPSPLYVVRLCEYSIFLYLGYCFSRHFSITAIAWPVFIFNGIAILLQLTGIWGGFTSDGYRSTVGRVVGLTAGPWEVGFVLNITFVAFAYSSSISRRLLFWLAAITFILLLMTESRASTASFLLIFLLAAFRGKRLGQMLLVAAAVAAIVFPLSLALSDKLAGRSENLLNIDNIDYVVDYYSALAPRHAFVQESFDDVGQGEDVDASWLIRSSHWAIALKEFFARPEYFPLGLGPGTFGPALDGAWTRILVETGIVGVICYIIFLRNIARRLPGGRLLVIACAINMLFIDIHLSYKSMAFLLFLIGFSGGRRGKITW